MFVNVYLKPWPMMPGHVTVDWSLPKESYADAVASCHAGGLTMTTEELDELLKHPEYHKA